MLEPGCHWDSVRKEMEEETEESTKDQRIKISNTAFNSPVATSKRAET
jgi:hypothetical protein